jgi:hypothetical protein
VESTENVRRRLVAEDDDEARGIPEQVFESVRRSGFPFQTRIAAEVAGESGWHLRAVEMPWSDDTFGDQFVDIIATRGSAFAVIECKKMEAAAFTFLRPLGMPHTTGLQDYAQLFCTVQTSRAVFQSDVHSVRMRPPSFESDLCVLATSKTGRDGRLLEPDCRLLLHATNWYVRRNRGLLGLQARQGGSTPEQSIFLPTVVTNARLFTARYDPNDISLDSGSFLEDPKETEEIDFIRFTKSFSSAESLTADRCTVFVVRAVALARFLHAVSIDD